MDNLAEFLNQWWGLITVLVAMVMGYGRLSQQTAGNTKSIDKLQDGLTEVRIQSARTEAKIDILMHQIMEKKA